MNTIKFNNTTFIVESFNKNTNFSGDMMSSTAYCNVIVSDSTAVQELASETIESIQIYHDETLIYDSQNLSGHIESINEYLGDNHMNFNINLRFDI